ncbi:MAG: lipopolysaccharide heptosyltransferase II [Caldimonas sp.]
MTRTIVIAPQWIGDAVMSEPLLRQLSERGDQLTVAALPWVAPVYRAIVPMPEIIELPFAHGRLDLSARRRIAATWRGRFDCALVLPNSIKSALLPWLADIPLRIGYRGEGRWLLLNRQLPNPSGRPPMVDFYSALAGTSASGATVAPVSPRLSFSDDELGDALRAAGLEREGYWVFAPGAEYGPAKRWPATRYSELARSLQDSDALPVVLLGSAGEASLCNAIAAAAPGACRVLAGQVPLLDAMKIIAGARGVVSNDSGLMHVAAAFGVPQVAVFGSTSPEHTPPLSHRAQVIWLKRELGLACMPCFDRTCRFGHTLCLNEIDVSRVEGALATALATE